MLYKKKVMIYLLPADTKKEESRENTFGKLL